MASLEREHCIGYAGGMNESLVLHPATGEAMYIAGGTIGASRLASLDGRFGEAPCHHDPISTLLAR